MKRRREIVDIVQSVFGANYVPVPAKEDSGSGIPVFEDSRSRLGWVYVPDGTFVMGLTGDQAEAAVRLAEAPFLTFSEMQPSATRTVQAMLVSQSPVSVVAALEARVPVQGQIGHDSVALVDFESADEIASHYGASLLNEVEWEYVCRAGTESLFWFGDRIPNRTSMERILGLRAPSLPNAFGLIELFHGEWCADYWAPSLDAAPNRDRGRVIRGGASRFWPWADSREWAACSSAYRMPASDTGGLGAAVRLVRRQ